MKANTISSRRDGIELAKQRLLVGDLDRQVGGDRVGERRRLLDLAELDAGLGRQALVELGVILELVDHRAHQRLGLGARRRSPRRPPRPRRRCSRRAAPDRPGARASRPRRARGRCRRAASAAASRWRRRRDRRARRGRDRPRPDRAGRPGTAPCPPPSRLSSAATDFSRPTNRGTMRCGKTTMSRSGKNGEKASHGLVYGRRPLTGATKRRNNPHESLALEAKEKRQWPTTGKRSAPARTKSRSTRPLPARDPASRTTALAPGEELPQPPTDEEVERVAEKLGAPTAESDTLPLEGE